MVGRGTFLQQEKALAGGTAGPDLQHCDLQVLNSLIPAPFVIASVCRNVLRFFPSRISAEYSRMSHPVTFWLLPAILQSVGAQPALGEQCCSPSHTQLWYGYTAASPSVTAPGWKGPQRALTLCLWSVRDQP